jgi:hypothetical protein
MHWIVADLLMFACSVAVYLAVRKAALDKLRPDATHRHAPADHEC